MTITLTPEVEATLQQRAQQNGQDVSAIAETLILMALDWEAREREEAITGIRRGLEASDAGRVRPASEVFAQMRGKLEGGD